MKISSTKHPSDDWQAVSILLAQTETRRRPEVLGREIHGGFGYVFKFIEMIMKWYDCENWDENLWDIDDIKNCLPLMLLISTATPLTCFTFLHEHFFPSTQQFRRRQVGEAEADDQQTPILRQVATVTGTGCQSWEGCCYWSRCCCWSWLVGVGVDS